MDAPGPTDEWDRAASRTRTDTELAAVAAEFLAFRKDTALGLAPAKLLPASTASNWILYWCAARRVDDSIEAGQSDPAEWRARLSDPGRGTLAERCVATLLASPAFADLDLPRLLDDSLRGVAMERRFDRPRPWADYEGLLGLKSVPTMHVFDALMAPDEASDIRAEHARAFAISAQLGDDCRDVLQDLARGRCFVTLEELGTAHLDEFVRIRGFAEGRRRQCLDFLGLADDAARRFGSPEARERASRLHALWAGALRSDQVRPTDAHLTFS